MAGDTQTALDIEGSNAAAVDSALAAEASLSAVQPLETSFTQSISSGLPPLSAAIVAVQASIVASLTLVPGPLTLENSRALVMEAALSVQVSALQELLPADDRWRHRHGSPGHGRDHVLPALVPPHATLPVIGGRLELGTWQSVVLVDTNRDNPHRQVRLTFLG